MGSVQSPSPFQAASHSPDKKNLTRRQEMLMSAQLKNQVGGHSEIQKNSAKTFRDTENSNPNIRKMVLSKSAAG